MRLSEYRVGERRLRFWLEWDRGTMNARDLAIKFTSYAHYVTSREWARERAVLPWLVCIVPDIAQERRVQRVSQAVLAHSPGAVIWTTTAALLKEYGPHAPIWLRTLPSSSRRAQPGDVRRSGLFDTLPEAL